MITRIAAVKNLNNHIGTELSLLAKKNNITTYINGSQNKGWKGMVLERLAGLENNNRQAPDGIEFELKSTAYYKVKGRWTPKETMAITMINPVVLVRTPFYQSHCWEKLKSIIFCAVSWHGCHNELSELLKVQSFDFIADEKLINEIESDYEFIRRKCAKSGFETLTGRDGKWIQARTKGAGHGSVSRAFYARKSLLKEILNF